MTRESLIAALDNLRTAYYQRRRMTNGLMTGFKAVTGGLNKTSRALEAYNDQESTLSPEVLAQTREAFRTLQIKEATIDPILPELRRESKAFAGVETALKDALAALGGTTVDVVRMDHALNALQAVTIEDAALAELLPQLQQELWQAQQQLGTIFGEALRAALAEQGITIGGRPPRFEIGRFEINANFAKRTAAISYGKDVTTGRVPLSVDAVVKAYQRDAKAVMERQEDGDRWIAQLYEAWNTVRRKRGTTSERANIVECYVEMTLLRQSRTFRTEPGKRTFRDYSRAQFAYDFFEFTNRQQRTHEGQRVVAHVATKSHAESAARSFWIVEGETPHDGRYISDIAFENA